VGEFYKVANSVHLMRKSCLRTAMGECRANWVSANPGPAAKTAGQVALRV